MLDIVTVSVNIGPVLLLAYIMCTTVHGYTVLYYSALY